MGPNDFAANGFAVLVNNVEKDPSGGGIVLLKVKMWEEEDKKTSTASAPQICNRRRLVLPNEKHW